MSENILALAKAHLATLLEAIQRCVYFLHASDQKLNWPLTAEYLATHKKDVLLFESLAAINERFAMLQDTLGAAMRHATLLSGEPGDIFLKVMSFYEKVGVIESVAAWQLCRATRNLAEHDYETEYADIAEHFNSLHRLKAQLIGDAGKFMRYSKDAIGVTPSRQDFASEFYVIVGDDS